MQMIFDKEICGEKDHEKENEKYAGDIAFLGSSTTSAAFFLYQNADTHTLWCLFITKKVLKMYYKHLNGFSRAPGMENPVGVLATRKSRF